MGPLLSYSITSGLLMLAMYLAYRLFPARDNQHGSTRAWRPRFPSPSAAPQPPTPPAAWPSTASR